MGAELETVDLAFKIYSAEDIPQSFFPTSFRLFMNYYYDCFF